MELLTALRAVSTLDEELERLLELVFTALRVASTLDEELLMLKLEV